jgi:hypothetical protein
MVVLEHDVLPEPAAAVLVLPQVLLQEIKRHLHQQTLPDQLPGAVAKDQNNLR